MNGNTPTSLSRANSDAWDRTDRARGQRVVLGWGRVGVGVDREISTRAALPGRPAPSYCKCHPLGVTLLLYNPAAVKTG